MTQIVEAHYRHLIAFEVIGIGMADIEVTDIEAVTDIEMVDIEVIDIVDIGLVFDSTTFWVRRFDFFLI